MAEINQEETQQELFLEFSGTAKSAERFPSLNKAHKPILLNTSVEQIILVSIVFILCCCFVFFLGVLRGKALNPLPLRLIPQNKAVSLVSRSVEMPKPTFNAGSVGAGRVGVTNESPISGASETPDISRPYTLQLSTYKKQEFADKEVAELRRSGYFTSIIPSDGFYQVCAGQYATKEDAKRDLKIFKAKYKDCFLRRR